MIKRALQHNIQDQPSDEVRTFLKSKLLSVPLKSAKLPGFVGFLQKCSNRAEELSLCPVLITAVWHKGGVPEDCQWKETLIMPHVKEDDPTKINGYRGIVCSMCRGRALQSS